MPERAIRQRSTVTVAVMNVDVASRLVTCSESNQYGVTAVTNVRIHSLKYL
jgi:hypothetical protein